MPFPHLGAEGDFVGRGSQSVPAKTPLHQSKARHVLIDLMTVHNQAWANGQHSPENPCGSRGEFYNNLAMAGNFPNEFSID